MVNAVYTPFLFCVSVYLWQKTYIQNIGSLIILYYIIIYILLYLIDHNW